MDLSEILFVSSCLLFLAMVTASVSRHFAIPYTVMLVVMGVGVRLAEPHITFLPVLNDFHITSELVFFVFLPALIFEASLRIDARELLKNLWPVVLLAIPGMLISMTLVGYGLWWVLGVNLTVAMLFGALISATDPVAVIAIFKDLGIAKRLTLLVEGESLFNDATAIVLFNMILTMILLPDFSYGTVMPAIPEFFRVFLGGIAVGVLIAVPISEMMVKLHHEDLAVPVVFSLVIPYLCFVLAEHAFQVSGVMSVLTAAICLNAAGLMRLSGKATEAVHTTWDVVVLICNSLLFLLIGMSIDIFTLVHFWQAILCAVLAVALARAISVYLFLPVTAKLFKFPAIDVNSQHIMWWGGLKGGLAIAIVLTVPDTLAEKPLLFELTLGVVLASLLMNASTIRYLISWLKIDTLAFSETVELKHNLERVNTAVDAVLHQFSQMHLLDREIKHSIGSSLEKELEIDIKELTLSQRLEFVRKNAIHAEREELEFLHDIGLLNYYTYLTYRDLLHHDLERSFEEFQLLKKSSMPAKNIFLRTEWRIIQFLGQYDWSQPLLINYQELRFANKLQHNVAGVLMAHAGLKVIKEHQRSLDLFQYFQLKKVYQNRLRSRQWLLREFSNHYSEFYHQYSYLLFQRIALHYSLRLVNEEHEAGKVSTKVFKRIDDRLRLALKKLPIVKAVLSLNRRDDWIKNVELFRGLPEPELKKISGNARYINFLPGDAVFQQGDKGHSIYILVGGRLDVYKLNRQGDNEHLAELREGCVVGVHALLEDTRRSATVKAKTHVTLLRLTVADIARMSKILPELQSRLRIIDSERIENADLG